MKILAIDPGPVESAFDARRDELRQRCKRYYEANKAKRLLKMKEYRSRNKEKIAVHKNKPVVKARNKETHKAWRASNLAHLAEKQKAFRLARPDAFKAYEKKRPVTKERRQKRNAASKQWHRLNPDKRAASYHKRRAVIKTEGSLTGQELRVIRLRDTTCFYCRGPLNNNGRGHIEHLTPLSRGGLHVASNVVIACVACNLKKGTKTAEEFRP